MRAIRYEETGDSSVLRLVERAATEPEAGQVRVRVAVSGVNPTDWKSRSGAAKPTGAKVPNQDGAGVIDAVGPDVTRFAAGDRVWLWDVAYRSDEGTAQELVTLPARHVMPLPDRASFDLGASLGIPALTAHLALTSHREKAKPLSPGALEGTVVLVTGGAGAVGNAAIQLAHWASATVIATVSSPEKARLAEAAGAHHIIDYRREGVAATVRAIAPGGADLIVDVAIAENIEDDLSALAAHGTIASYAYDANPRLTMPIGPAVVGNARLRFILTYTAGEVEKRAALDGVQAALEAGALGVGEQHGLPLTRFPLEQTAAAHDAVEAGTIGKVLIDVAASAE